MTAREAIAEMRDMVSDRNGDYHKDDDVLRYLNRAAQYVSNESESVRSGLYRPVIEGQGTYGMRADVLQIDFVGFKGQNESQYTPLNPLRNIGAETINRNSENARPINYSLWGRSAVEKFLGQRRHCSRSRRRIYPRPNRRARRSKGRRYHSKRIRPRSASHTDKRCIQEHRHTTSARRASRRREHNPFRRRRGANLIARPGQTNNPHFTATGFHIRRRRREPFHLLRPQTPHHNPSEHRRHERRP